MMLLLVLAGTMPLPGKLLTTISDSCLKPTNIEARSNRSLSDNIILFLIGTVWWVDKTDLSHCWNQFKHWSIWLSLLSVVDCTGLGSSNISIIVLEISSNSIVGSNRDPSASLNEFLYA